MALEVAADEAVGRHAEVERGRAGVVDGGAPYFLASDSTPRMRRTPSSPSRRWIASQSAPICVPAVAARASSCSVVGGVCAGLSSSGGAVAAAVLRAGARAAAAPVVRIEQAHVLPSHWTGTARPIQPGGAA